MTVDLIARSCDRTSGRPLHALTQGLCLDPKFGSKFQSFSITSICHTHTTFQSHHLQFQPKFKLFAELNTAKSVLRSLHARKQSSFRETGVATWHNFPFDFLHGIRIIRFVGQSDFCPLTAKPGTTRSPTYEKPGKRGHLAVWMAVLADVAHTWLLWLDLRPMWHLRGAYMAILSQK